MKLLAIDTSTEACSAALWLDGEVRERYELAPRGHAGLILPMVEALLQEAGLALRALDAIGLGRGPGAFTGIRIGVGVVQGLAFGADLPVVPVSTLAALAQGEHRRAGDQRVLAAIDARMGEVYWGAYRCDGEGLMRLVGDERVCAPERVPMPEEGEWTGVGSGWDSYHGPLLARLTGRVHAWREGRFPHAGDVARLAADGLARGQAVAAEQALPVYLRDEVAWKKSS